MNNKINEEILKGFEENDKQFRILAGEVITYVHDELKCHLSETPSSFAGRKVFFNKIIGSDFFVAFEVFANGHITFKYGDKSKDDNTLDDYIPDTFFYLQKDKEGKKLKEAIEKAKKHLKI